MNDKASPDARLKSASDLWIHQNTMMWGRLQTLAILQAGFLGIAFTLSAKHHPVLGFLSCLLLIGLTLSLWRISKADRRIRNTYADKLASVGFEIHTWDIPAFGAAAYIGAAFLSLSIIDFVAALVIAFG